MWGIVYLTPLCFASPLSTLLHPSYALTAFPPFPFCYLYLTISPSPRGLAVLPLAPDPSGEATATPAAPRLACCAVPNLVPVALSPKGNSHQRQWAAYQGKQQPPPCQPTTKARDREKERRANTVQYCTVAEKTPLYTKPSQTHSS